MSNGINDILEFCEDYNDPSKQIEIYTSFINKAILEDSDRESLKQERGFNDSIIDLLQYKSCRPQNAQVIEDLKNEFQEDELIDAGVLEATDKGIKPCSQLLGVFKDDKFVNNIVIPYFDENQKIHYIRPHKFGLKGKGIHIYCPVRSMPINPWIITESEFKAAAALQFGYPSLGLPGIHSFSASNFGRLKEFIEQIDDIENLVILFDNEIKTNPKFKNYKQDVRKQWDTQWRSYQLAEKLYKELSLRSVKIGVLPDDWMEEGKIDIDGALAQGRTKEQFKAVVYASCIPSEYLKKLPPVAKKIITSKKHKELIKSISPVEKDLNKYVIKKKGKPRRSASGEQEEPEIFYIPVSNFIMQINKVLVEGAIHIREITFFGQDGSISKPYMMDPNGMQLRDFRTWIASCGNFVFEGNQDDLIQIWKYEFAMCDSRVIYRPEEIGYMRHEKEPLWLFGNCLLKADNSMLLPDDEGIIWDGLEGYLPRSIKENNKSTAAVPTTKMPIINLDADTTFDIHDLKDTAKKIEIVYGTKAIYLSIGWVIACLLSEEIYKKYACFPLLFIGGKRESGKTTLGNWLMAMAGMSDTAGEALENTSPAGVERNLAWFSSLPYWLDEYRNNAKVKKWDGFFRNVYQRQSASKGTLKATIRSHEVNAGIILSGEETPEDNALLSRCIVIPLIANKARKNDEATESLFSEIEDLRTTGLLSRLILEVIKRKEKLLPHILKNIDGWKKRMQDKGVGERIALNYAIPAVCYDSIFFNQKDMEERKAFVNWVVNESHRTELEKESEHMLSIFMESLVGLQEDLQNFYCVYVENGKRYIALHFPTFYRTWAVDDRRLGHEQFKKQTMLSYIREETYYVDDNKLKRVNGKTTRCLILSLDPSDNPPSGLATLADGEGPSGSTPDTMTEAELPF